MNLMRTKYLSVALLMFSAATTLYSQTSARPEAQPVDVAVLFRAERSQYSYGEHFWMYGGTGEIAVHTKYRLSLVLNTTGTTYQGGAPQNSFSKVMVTAGPRYTLPLTYKRSQIFVDALLGGVHGFDSVFPSPNGALQSANAFAMQAGGGYDISLSHTWALRAVDVHYVRHDLPNGFSDRQSDLLLGTGIIWRPVDRSKR